MLPLLLFTLPVRIAGEALHDNSPSCKCYAVTSDNSPTYFLYHRFYDFRYFGNGSTILSAPPTVTRWGGQELTPDQDALNGTAFTDDWGIMNWSKKAASDAPVKMQNTPQNVYLTISNSTDLASADPAATTYLTLRTSRLPDFQSSAEIESEQKNLMYASMRFRARVTGSAGAVAGLFTFYDDNNEADIEILTRDPHTTYRFTNQPAVDKKGDDVPAASQAPTDLPSWQQWRTHRIDWVRGVVRWYVDDVLVARNSYSVPRRPSGIVLNLWGDGGEWGGEMAVGDQALMDVQWVEMVFNTSGRRDGPKKRKGSKKTKRGLHAVDDAPAHWFQKRKKRRNCMTVCAIDDVAQIGFPEVKFIASMASAGGAARAWLLVACLAIALDFIVGA